MTNVGIICLRVKKIRKRSNFTLAPSRKKGYTCLDMERTSYSTKAFTLRTVLLSILTVILFMFASQTAEAASKEVKPAYPSMEEGVKSQYSHFPIPLNQYKPTAPDASLVEILVQRNEESNGFNLAVTLVFFGAIIHTFLASRFERLSHRLAQRYKEKLKSNKFRVMHPEERMPVSFFSSLFHFLGEVEAVFGIWIIPFMIVCWKYYSFEDFSAYLNFDCSFIEPMFVMIIMIIASSRPIFKLAERAVCLGANLGKGTPGAWWISVMCLSPLLGSLITEPAAMTIGALILSKKFYDLKPKRTLMYATLALLFVNISIGGTLTHFAAPPVVMVAEKWDWGLSHMFYHFGWKAIVAVLISNIAYYFLFRKEFARLADQQREMSEFDDAIPQSWEDRNDTIPLWVTLVHVCFLTWTVIFAHEPVMFIGSFLFFIGFTVTTPQYQNHMALRVPMMVGFFLAGLVILGGVQAWWLEPVLARLGDYAMVGATLLTAFNDNAAVTFLASTVPNLPESVKYAVVAGAVTGGGLTVIANAPNPAGQAILGKYFQGINPLWLFVWALFPTVVVFIFFSCFGN